MNVALGCGLKQRCVQNLSAENDNIPTVIKTGPIIFLLQHVIQHEGLAANTTHTSHMPLCLQFR